ncbi:unnamed protein product [Chondrus crispus]|uniref:Ubiquitin carboxyl-terminal hydrolase n=1 Tax=Chondrus crispus TaxID=2769 RepID=R7QA88_CHOCR|nr:unnamed protein product [Chondrus crispus]CDF34331.1 unnamed protein product [Chondrus crispus]|eukprot:XP_005714150.1 unnamed protein product [Chondrus crispus]
MPAVQLVAGYYNESPVAPPKHYHSAARPLSPATRRAHHALKPDPLPPTPRCDPIVAQLGFSGRWVTPEHPDLPLLWDSHRFRGVVGLAQGPGLANIGNSCFMNAALQALLHCPPVAALFMRKVHLSKRPLEETNCVLCALQALAADILEKKGVIAPVPFGKRLRHVCKGFRLGQQEDAHEFLRGLLENIALRETFGCLADKNKVRITRHQEMLSSVHRIFGGMFQTCIHCTKCNHRSNTVEPFLDMSLDLSPGKMGIIPALNKFTAPEQLHGANQYRCDACGHKVRANKRTTIRRAPNVLTLHLKRFNWAGKKTHGFVQYPALLNLAPYMPGKPDCPAPTYRLSSVVVHTGTSKSGHYFAFVRGRDGRWYRKDDARSVQVSAETVMKQDAYILFYTRMPTPEAPNPQHAARPTRRPRSATPLPETSKPSAPTGLSIPERAWRTAQAALRGRRSTPLEEQRPRKAPDSDAQAKGPAKSPTDVKPVQRYSWPKLGRSEEPQPSLCPKKETEGEIRSGTALLIGGSATVTKILQRVFRLEATVRKARKRSIDEVEPAREPESRPSRLRRRQKEE